MKTVDVGKAINDTTTAQQNNIISISVSSMTQI